MTDAMRKMKRMVLSVLGLAIAGLGLQAQTYSIDRATIGAGGGRSVAGDYVLEGTIGQPDAGPVLRGGNYELQGGFWPGWIVVGPGLAPMLFIQLVGPEVLVSWTPDTPGFILETTDNIVRGTWVPAPEGNPAVMVIDGQTRFYRLRMVD